MIVRGTQSVDVSITDVDLFQALMYRIDYDDYISKSITKDYHNNHPLKKDDSDYRKKAFLREMLKEFMKLENNQFL